MEKKAMEFWGDEAFDSIDAGFFSGDSFHDADILDEIEKYMERWKREIENIRELLQEKKR